MSNYLTIASTAIMLNCAGAPAFHAHAQSVAPVEGGYVESIMLLRHASKCAHAPQCRKAVAERAERIAKRTIELMTDIATGIADQISALLADLDQTPEDREILKKLDELDALLKKNRLQCPELRREIAAIRALHQ